MPVSISTSRFTRATLVLTSAVDSGRFCWRCTWWMLSSKAVSVSATSAFLKALPEPSASSTICTGVLLRPGSSVYFMAATVAGGWPLKQSTTACTAAS